jgi:hypothetical protein
MYRSPMPSTYDGPTVMWRMQRSGGLSAHAVIGLLPGRGVCVMWFLNDRPIGARECEDWSSALEWSDRLRNQNWTVGWRLSKDQER